MRLSYQKITFLIAVGLFFVLQIIQLCFKPFPEPGLRGLQVEPPWPVLSFQSWATGEFQEGYEKWLGYNFGFRGYWIRTYNQIAYSLFKEASQGADDKIIVGKKDQLFERAYIDEYFNYIPPAAISDLAAKAQRIKRLQDLLQQRGIASIVLITPSKASIYPEYIPDAFNIPVKQERNYPNFVNFLKQYDVQYVDGHEITAEQKRKSEYPLFCRGGTHWNYLGAYYTTREMILKWQEQVNQSMTNLGCTRVDIDDNPTGSDKDLAYLLNLWRTPDRYPTPHPAITAAPGVFKPNVLFVGGSFAGLIVQTLAQNGVCSNIDYYFYYNKRLVCEDGGKELKEAGLLDKLDWERDVFGRDIIVLEVNEQNIPNMGSGFIEDALSKLEPSEVSFVLKNEDYVTEVPVNGKKGYLFKKGAPASGCLYLATDYLALEPGVEYEIAYTAKGYKTLKLDIGGDGFTQTENDSIQNEEKRYFHQFKYVNKGNYVLRFYIDGETGFTDKDTLIYDVQLKRITKH